MYGITCSVGDSGRIRQEQAKDFYTSEIIQRLQEGKHSATQDDFHLEDGILVRQLKNSNNLSMQVVVPIALRQTILEQLHNNAGHLGIRKTFEKVNEQFFWPGYEQDVKMLSSDVTVVKGETILFPSIKPRLALLKVNIPFKKYHGISWVHYQLRQEGTNIYLW